MNRTSSNENKNFPRLSAQERTWLETQVAFGVDATVADTPMVYLSCRDSTIGAVPAPVHEPDHQVAQPDAPEVAMKKVPSVSKTAAPQQSSVRSKTKPPPSVPLMRACADAEEKAKAAQTLPELRERLEKFDGCPLKATAGNLVFGTGVNNPVVMLIGEGPGGEEDRRGIPFVGPSGRLMQRALEIIGLNTQTNLYISNTVYWRPPADRTPHDTEIATCLPFLRRQIALVNPKLLVLVGARAAQTFLATTSGITRIRGSWTETAQGILPDPLPALPVFHPAYLFRNHAQKRLFWHDILRLRQQIDALSLDVPWPQQGLRGFSSDWQIPSL